MPKSKRILSVSFKETQFEWIECEERSGRLSCQTISSSRTDRDFLSACKRASSIYVTAHFPSLIHSFATIPKVSKRDIAKLVAQEALEKTILSEKLHTGYIHVRDFAGADGPKREVAYVAVPEQDLMGLWHKLKEFSSKIRHIISLPAALVTCISQVEAHDWMAVEDFVLVWVGERSSLIAVSAPNSLVKVSRHMPFGLERGNQFSTEKAAGYFKDLAKDISGSVKSYESEFRGTRLKHLYFVGDSRAEVESLFRQAVDDSGIGLNVHAGVQRSPIEGWTPAQANEHIDLIGNFFIKQTGINLVPKEEKIRRGLNYWFEASFAGLGVLILILFVIAFRIEPVSQDRLDAYNRLRQDWETTHQELTIIKKEMNVLTSFQGWKRFYDDTYKNQPAWDGLISEVATLIPHNVIVESVQILPVQSGGSLIWEGQMAGKIKAENWQNGLNLLRQFGIKLERSSFVHVTNVHYAPQNPGNAGDGDQYFGYQITLRLSPRGQGS